jgi:hypothetical protein
LSDDFAIVSDLGSGLPSTPATPSWTFTAQPDLYSPAGEHLAALRLPALVAGSENPIAAANDELVMRTGSAPGFAPSQTLLHFGTVVDGQFKERRQVKLVPPVAGGILIIAPDGNLLPIDKASGNMVIVDSRAKGGR